MVLGWGDDGTIEFVMAGTKDMFHEGDTFDMDMGDGPCQVRVVDATFAEGRVVLPNWDVFPGRWVVRVVQHDA